MLNLIFTTISIIVTCIATCFIAYYTKQTRDVYKRMEDSQKQSQEKISDLYQAIVIATLQSSNSAQEAMPGFIAEFSKHYKGKTKIF
jgi:hypothetical protein